MNKDNEKQLLTTGVYEAPKCEVVEMMGEGALLYGENSGITPQKSSPEEVLMMRMKIINSIYLIL